jgi:hypothetical protein
MWLRLSTFKQHTASLYSIGTASQIQVDTIHTPPMVRAVIGSSSERILTTGSTVSSYSSYYGRQMANDEYV